MAATFGFWWCLNFECEYSLDSAIQEVCCQEFSYCPISLLVEMFINNLMRLVSWQSLARVKIGNYFSSTLGVNNMITLRRPLSCYLFFSFFLTYLNGIIFTLLCHRTDRTVKHIEVLLDETTQKYRVKDESDAVSYANFLQFDSIQQLLDQCKQHASKMGTVLVYDLQHNL